jgi:hypothetical protein
VASNPWFSDAAAEASVNAIAALCNGGTLNVYSGTQPADANQPAAGTLLATLTFAATAFASATASGSPGSRVAAATANAIAGSVAAAGTASWFRVLESGGVTAVLDGSAGAKGCDLNFDSVAFVPGTAVSVNSFTISQNE